MMPVKSLSINSLPSGLESASFTSIPRCSTTTRRNCPAVEVDLIGVRLAAGDLALDWLAWNERRLTSFLRLNDRATRKRRRLKAEQQLPLQARSAE